MASVRIATERFTSGDLPAVCARTGTPTERRGRITAVSTPGWTWVLLLLGVVPFLVAYALTKRQIEGVVPLSAEAYSRARAWAWISAAALTLLVVLTFAPALLQVSLGLEVLLVALGIVGAIGLVMTYASSVRARWQEDGAWVTLHHVHPRFVEALAATFTAEYGAALVHRSKPGRGGWG